MLCWLQTFGTDSFPLMSLTRLHIASAFFFLALSAFFWDLVSTQHADIRSTLLMVAAVAHSIAQASMRQVMELLV